MQVLTYFISPAFFIMNGEEIMMKKISLFLIVYSLLVAKNAFAIVNISTTGWTYNLADTITNAGDYYNSVLDSDLPATANVSIDTAGNTAEQWKVCAALSNVVSGIKINVKRNDSGSGGTISDGNSYVELNTTEKYLFQGQGSISSIQLLFKLENFDVNDGYGDKNFNIAYRVTTDSPSTTSCL